MGIHQLSVVYDEVQDRLLWRINTHEAQEYRFWMTRRLMLRLMPHLKNHWVQAESRQAGLSSQPAATQHLMADFQRQAFLEKADFKQPFAPAQAPSALPLGEAPMLVTEVQITPQAGQQVQMVLHHKLPGATQVQSAQLMLGSELLQGLLHLSEAATRQAKWLAPETAQSNKETDTHSAPNPSSFAH
jgi:hypothetical protein